MDNELWIALSGGLFFILLTLRMINARRIAKEDMVSRIQRMEDQNIAQLIRKVEGPKESWADRKSRELQQIDPWWTFPRYLMILLISIIGGYVLGILFLHAQWLAILSAIGASQIPTIILNRAIRTNQKQFALYYRNTLVRIASMLRAGNNVAQSVYDVAVAPDTHPLIRKEFLHMHTELEYGNRLEVVFDNMYQRTGSEDVKMTKMMIEIQSEKGGNLAELLEGLQEAITERANQQRKLQTMTAQQRSQANLLSMLPVFVYLVLMLIQPEYYDQFLESLAGQIIMVVCVGFILVGRYVMNKISGLD